MMKAWNGMAAVIGTIGVLFLVTACSKSLQNTGMDGTTAPAMTAASTSGSALASKSGSALASASGSAPAPTPPDRPALKPVDDIAAASGTFPSLSGVEPGESLMTSKGGKEQIIPPSDIVVAKADTSDAARRRAEEMQREQLATAAAGLEDVFFAFDSWQLTAEAKQALMVDSEWIKSNGDKSILIEGHCDERGTQAYNLVLGEKRAKAVKKYLSELGVQGTRLAVVSYGKERPFCKDRAESCYQKNRRGHIVLRSN